MTTTYTNDVFGLTQVLVADDGTAQVTNLFGLDLISQDSGSEVRTLLVDGLGSVRMEMVGNVVETATTYSPYGEVLEQTGASGTVYGFTGGQEDGATGLLYLRARYYSPALKVFQSRDPWEGTGWRPNTLSPYVYSGQNPVNFTDPSGLLYCRASKSGCADWLIDVLERIKDNPSPLGAFLVNKLWDRDIALLQENACESSSQRHGFGVIITDSFPWPSGGFGLATRPSTIYVKERFFQPPQMAGDPTVLLFAHELVHLVQTPVLAASIYAEAQAYQIQAILRQAGNYSNPPSEAETDAKRVDLNDSASLLSQLFWWRSQHWRLYGIVPLLPLGLEALPGTGGAELTIQTFSLLFPPYTVPWVQNPPPLTPMPPIPPLPTGPRHPPSPPPGTPISPLP